MTGSIDDRVLVQVALDPGDRALLRPLFELAEDSGPALDSYINEGRVLVASLEDDAVGHLQLVETARPGCIEIKNMAVRADWQGRGVGGQLVRAAVELATDEGWGSMVVATAAAGVGNLRFYQRQGFRLLSVERDAFTPETGYPAGVTIDGIVLRDRVWLDRPLAPGPDPGRPRVLLICGSTRGGSSNSLGLAAVHTLEHPGVVTDLYDRLLDLPPFVPDPDKLPEPVRDLLDRIARSDAVLFSTPEYAGSLPGTLKNLLDWTVGGGQLYGKPVAWLDVANPGRGAGARSELQTVLGYVGSQVVEAACVHVPLLRHEGRAELDPSYVHLLPDALGALVAAAEENGVE